MLCVHSGWGFRTVDILSTNDKSTSTEQFCSDILDKSIQLKICVTKNSSLFLKTPKIGMQGGEGDTTNNYYTLNEKHY